MRCTPPKITRAVSTTTTPPTTNGIQAAADSSATPTMVRASVLAWSELNANGKHMISSTENATASLRDPSPRSM
jgi:hypothetical protein